MGRCSFNSTEDPQNDTPCSKKSTCTPVKMSGSFTDNLAKKAIHLADVLKASADAVAMDASTALPRLPRTNRATTALGRFQTETDAESFDVNLRLSCDGPRKCLQLVFSREKKTLGYIPTEVRPGAFLLRGIWVNLDLRCRGLASIFLALWCGAW
ncbi:hypothetical protein AK812_SmicGene20997 [Symbiodinium microadriaticum]|uniref:Uncharacterized protein n=1 Tax=Symbiodinium microadriaticum TaxID=2951 RepID=A0A1Q9DNF4_SYMMI|nr:hypothetical protein AK812_SmicGene20997 [Symbiodinium microadriaticum]